MALVLLGDRDHEPEVGVDHALLGLEIAALDALGQLDLLVRRQEVVPAHLVEEELEGVGGGGGEIAVRVARRLDAVLAAVVGHGQAARLDAVVQLLALLVVERQLLHQLAQLGEVHAADLLAPVQQALEALVESGG